VSMSTSGTERVVSEFKRRKIAILIALAAIALAIVGLSAYFRASSTEGGSIKSIAVLPFENQNHDPDMEYRSDGLTESIINSLTQLQPLRVIARSSVFRYKGRELDPMAVGHELGVRAVVTGRIMQRGDTLNISVELIDVTENKQLWGEQFEPRVSELLAVQREIAKEISNNLRLKLSGTDQQRLTKNYTDNAEAYQLYLKGRYYWNKRTEEGLRKGIEYFQNAIDRDPNYALAYSGLADCYNSFGFSFDVGSLPPGEAIPKAKAAAAKALEIDDTLAEAHTSLAYARQLYDWDWSGSEREFKRAFELNPNYVNAHHWYSHYLIALGRTQESLAESKRSLELAPLDLIINTHLGWNYIFVHQYDQAIEQLRKTLELDPNYGLVHWYLGLAYEQKGMYAEAAPEFLKGMELLKENMVVETDMGHFYAVSGKRAEAQKIVEKAREITKQRYVSAYQVALIYTGLEERERAFDWLEKAYQEHADSLVYLKVDPRLESLRSDPRFVDLVRRVGL
jgi:TolB-like protein/Flp pilus assembly protein TadD